MPLVPTLTQPPGVTAFYMALARGGGLKNAGGRRKMKCPCRCGRRRLPQPSNAFLRSHTAMVDSTLALWRPKKDRGSAWNLIMKYVLLNGAVCVSHNTTMSPQQHLRWDRNAVGGWRLVCFCTQHMQCMQMSQARAVICNSYTQICCCVRKIICTLWAV